MRLVVDVCVETGELLGICSSAPWHATWQIQGGSLNGVSHPGRIEVLAVRLVLDVSGEKGKMLAFFTADAACKGATTANYLSIGALWRGPLSRFFRHRFLQHFTEAGCRGATTAMFLLRWCSLEGATIAFFVTVFFVCSMICGDFWCLFRPGGCLWSLRGCPWTPEAAQASFLDAFWVDLELLLGGLGDHFWSLFGACFAVSFWSGFGAGFCQILAPFWVALLVPFVGPG